MNELERARQRISGEEQEFKAVVEPQLLQMEAEFMAGLPPRLQTLFGEVQEEIGAAMGVPIDQRIGFYYRFVDEKEYLQRYQHEIRNTYDGKHLEWWEVGKPHSEGIVRKLETNYRGNVEEVVYERTGFEFRRETPKRLLAISKEHAILSENIRISSVQISFYDSQTYNRNIAEGRHQWENWSGIGFTIKVEKNSIDSIRLFSPAGSNEGYVRMYQDRETDELIDTLAVDVVHLIGRKRYMGRGQAGRTAP